MDICMSNLKVRDGHTYVQAYEFHDIRMSNLDMRTSNLSMLFYVTISNFLTTRSFKILKKHSESYIQSWIFGSFVLSKFQYHLGHLGHTYVQVGHMYFQVGHTYVHSNNASTVKLLMSLKTIWTWQRNFEREYLIKWSGLLDISVDIVLIK